MPESTNPSDDHHTWDMLSMFDVDSQITLLKEDNQRLEERNDHLWGLISRLQKDSDDNRLKVTQLYLLKEDNQRLEGRSDHLWEVLSRLQNWASLSHLPKDLLKDVQTALVDYQPSKEDTCDDRGPN
jgi:hypothetical protein